MTDNRTTLYFAELNRKITQTQVTDGSGGALDMEYSVIACGDAAGAVTTAGGTIFFIGNGGSAGIASHMAIDYTKNGKMRALAFNDGAYLTCLGNDLGFDQVFAKPLDMHARKGDLLIAISSSGRSANILNGVEVARNRGCRILTFSGFTSDNPLRTRGDFNFYIASGEYGFVEVGHLALIHSILDLAMGWGNETASAKAAE